MARYVAVLATMVLLASCSSAVKVMKYGIPDVYDYQVFESQTISASQDPFYFTQINNVTLPPADLWSCEKKVDEGCSAETFMEETNTLALIVIRRDTIIYENYANGHSRDSKSQIFSVTKSFMSTLVGIAFDEGFIKDIDQSVADFLPEFTKGDLSKITIRHLLDMTSGINFSDYKNPAKLVNLYYSSDQSKLLKRLKVKYEPGTHFAYSSMSTYILGLCLEEATGTPVAEYLQEKLWEPLGMEYDATIAIDEMTGHAKSYGGLAARAVDLAKLGRLYLNGGMWNGERILSEEWVNQCRNRDKEGGAWKYSRQWWLDTYDGEVPATEKHDLFAGGYRGQMIYVNPNDSIIIVRLGTSEKGVRWGHTLSKLAMLPLEADPVQTNEYILAGVSGKYRNKKLDKFIEVIFKDGELLVSGYDADDAGAVHMLKGNEFSFVNKERKLKVLVNYQNHQVKGLILEGEDADVASIFFEKM